MEIEVDLHTSSHGLKPTYHRPKRYLPKKLRDTFKTQQKFLIPTIIAEGGQKFDENIVEEMVRSAKTKSFEGQPQVKILLLGDNNLRRLKEDPNDYIQLVKNLVHEFKNIEKCHLVLTSLLPSPLTDHICKDVFKDVSEKLKNIARQEGQNNKVSFLNLTKFLKNGKINEELYNDDKIHLNEEGATVLADSLLKHLLLRPNKIWK